MKKNKPKFILLFVFGVVCHLPIYSQITGIVTNCSTPNTSNGTISLTVQGGDSPYVFYWDNEETTSELTNLLTGQYCVTVTDATCCQARMCFYVNTCDNKQLEIVQLAEDTGFGTGALEIISEGHEPFKYTWSGPNGFSATDKVIKGLFAGNYEVTITNGDGCESILTGEVKKKGCDIKYIPPVIVQGCEGGKNSSISFEEMAKSGDYIFSWNSPTNSNFSEDTPKIKNIEAGDYCAIIIDLYYCKTEKCFTIAPNSIKFTNPATECAEIGNTVYLSVGSTTDPLCATCTYLWNDGETTKQRTFLKSGTYSVTVSSTSGCSATKQYEVYNLNPKIVDACNAPPFWGAITSHNGSISFEPNPQLSLKWSDGSNHFEQINVAINTTYTVTITSKSGCSFVKTATVGELNGDDFKLTSIPCKPFSATIEFINPSNLITWQSGNSISGTEVSVDGTIQITNLTQNPGIITGTQANTSLQIVDSRGCIIKKEVLLEDRTFHLNILEHGGCKGGELKAGVEIEDHVPGYTTAPFTYTWSEGTVHKKTVENTSRVLGQSNKIYSVTATNAFGCSATKSITMTENSPPNLKYLL